MNTAILFVEVVLAFSAVVLADRLFKSHGLTAWVAVASVVANIMTAKTSVILGMDSTLGTVLFASTFLATDILCERYGAQDARRAVFIGLASIITFTVASQLALLYAPSAYDYADGAMRTLFSLNLRISVASAVMYVIANLADVHIYSRLKRRGGAMWVRNNVSTILCNCLENFLFILFAFYGIYSLKECMVIAASTSVIEAVVAICDTPFLYIARSMRNGNEPTLSKR